MFKNKAKFFFAVYASLTAIQYSFAGTNEQSQVSSWVGNPDVAGNLDSGKGEIFNFFCFGSAAVMPNDVIYCADPDRRRILSLNGGQISVFISKNEIKSFGPDFYPLALASDQSNNLLILDGANHALWKINPQNKSTNPQKLYQFAEDDFLESFTTDPAGNAYVGYWSWRNGPTIRKITTNGTSAFEIQLKPGNGVIDKKIDLNYLAIYGMVFDSNSNLFYLSSSLNSVLKVDMNGTATVLAGSPGLIGSEDGVGTNARFNTPYGLAFSSDHNKIYVTDIYSEDGKAIRQIQIGSSGGRSSVTTLNVGVNDPTGEQLRSLNWISVKASQSGDILTVGKDGGAGVLRISSDLKVTSLSPKSKCWDPSSGWTPKNQDAKTCTGPLFSDNMNAIAKDRNGYFYLADSGNQVIRRIASDKSVVTIAGIPLQAGFRNGDSKQALFNFPSGLAVGSDSTVYISEGAGHRVRKMTCNSRGQCSVTTLAGNGEAGDQDAPAGSPQSAQFDQPYGLALDRTEKFLFVADSGNGKIKQIDLISGRVATIASGLKFPFALAVSPADRVYIADLKAHTIKMIDLRSSSDASGRYRVSTVAGQAGVAAKVDGQGSRVRFNNPYALLIQDGSLYIGEHGAIRKLEIDSGRVTVSTVAGTGGVGHAEGAASGAQFAYPSGLVFDSSGNLIVSDAGNQVLRLISSPR